MYQFHIYVCMVKNGHYTSEIYKRTVFCIETTVISTRQIYILTNSETNKDHIYIIKIRPPYLYNENSGIGKTISLYLNKSHNPYYLNLDDFAAIVKH